MMWMIVGLLLGGTILGAILYRVGLKWSAERRLKLFLETHPQTRLTDEQCRWLTFGAILALYRKEPLLSLVTDQNLAHCARRLRERWDIVNREQALSAIYDLMNYVKTTELDKAVRVNKGSRRLLQYQQAIAQGLHVDLKQVQTTVSTYAWDTCRLVVLAKWCYWLHFITEDEMWRFLSQGVMVAANKGKSWQDYTVSFLLGRLFHGEDIDDLASAAKELYHEQDRYEGRAVYLRSSFK